MKYLKQFWRDLGRLSKPQFGLKYVVPAIAVFFTYGAVGHFYVSYLSLDDLQKQTGQPLYADVRFLQGTKHNYKYYPLYIQLDNSPKEFRLMDTYNEYFPFIQDQVNAAKEITIYYRTPFQTFMGFGKETDIIQINKGNTTIFSMETVGKHSRKTSLMMFVFAAILWGIYYWFYVRKQQNSRPDKAAYNRGLASVGLKE